MSETKKAVLLPLIVLAAALPSAAEFSAGFSRVDITPAIGTTMTGYYKSRHVKSVLDPLQINCVAFSDGKTKALVMQVDTMTICDSIADRMRAAAAKASGAPRGAILVHASHTHDSGILSSDKGVTGQDRLYIEHCILRAGDAAAAAVADLKPASLSYGRSVARRISFVRRYRMKNGKVRTNPGIENPDIVAPVSEPDEEVQVLRIDRTGGKPLCIVNFQTHPDVVGGETVTADWPGLTRTVFEAATFGEALCLVLNGTEGDVNHVNVHPKAGERNHLKLDFDDADRGYGHAKHMANVLAGAALSVWMKCAPLPAGDIRYADVTVRVPSQRETDPAKLAQARKYWALHKAGKDAEIPYKGMELTTEVARAGRIVRLANGPEAFDVPIFGVAIGRAVAFCGYPGEPFNDIGKSVKKSSPFALTVPVCLTNGSRGYFPFSASYAEDGYEPATSPFGPSVADDLIAGTAKLLGMMLK